MCVFIFKDGPKTPLNNNNTNTNHEDHPVEDLVNDTKDRPPVTVKSTELETPKGRLVVTTTSEGTDLKKVVIEKNDEAAGAQKPTQVETDEKTESKCRVTVTT